jgi:tetratricopeptide (TPR) repeat protein
MLAHHYASSVNTEKAVEYLDRANQKAVRLYAMEGAKVYFDQAMEFLDLLPDTELNQKRRLSLLANQIAMFELLYKFQEYYDLLTRYEPMAGALDNPELLGAFYNALGYCEYSLGYFDQSIQTLTKAAELAETSGNIEEVGHAYVRLEWSHVYRGDFERVLAFKEQFLRMMEQRFNFYWHGRALTAASRAYTYLGRWDEAVEEGQKALDAAEEFSDDSQLSFAAFCISMAYNFQGDLDRAVEYGKLAVDRAPTPFDRALGQRVLGWAWCRAGEPERGIELLIAVMPSIRAAHFMPSAIPHTCTLGEGYWLAGDDHKAKQTLEEGLKIAESCGTKYYLGFAHRVLGEIALKTNPTEAEAHFEKSLALFREIKAENELGLAYVGYGRLQKQQGKIEQAREYLTKALETFERLGTLIEPDKTRKELAELPKAKMPGTTPYHA